MTPIVRPWGSYEILGSGPRYQVKRLIVNVTGQLSLQYHKKRQEHWVVVQGEAGVDYVQLATHEIEEVHYVERSDIPHFFPSTPIPMRQGDTLTIPIGCVHRLMNTGDSPLVVIETQIGSYLGEDDIVRLEDAYGRA